MQVLSIECSVYWTLEGSRDNQWKMHSISSLKSQQISLHTSHTHWFTTCWLLCILFGGGGHFARQLLSFLLSLNQWLTFLVTVGYPVPLHLLFSSWFQWIPVHTYVLSAANLIREMLHVPSYILSFLHYFFVLYFFPNLFKYNCHYFVSCSD